MNKLKRSQTVILLMIAIVLFLMMPCLGDPQLGFPWISSLALASELTPHLTQKSADAEHLTQTNFVSPTSAYTTSSLETQKSPASYRPDVTFKLETSIGEGKFIFSGVGNKINGIANPDLKVKIGEIVQLILVNGEGGEHDIALPDFNTNSDTVVAKGASSVIVFRADKQGVFPYFCTIPGHRQAGMEGRLIVMGKDETQTATSLITSIVRNPTDLPKPISDRSPKLVQVNFEVVELQGQPHPEIFHQDAANKLE
ncbi:cupredoxin domain-containing protein [Nostoc flagelliforme FACHB-838]|uniref:Cupredoxin domain-containing protein n=1 Tax=Nostoc flagelliforme FACHB-838 TaxID=2692904 RepID=A0ABR8DII7_9NOSO|nr:cupredoxin domain-containing protein [Nostoc flagelliforme]MBD2528223.1 cupredoxin domain-containing protein [Nostoc flagelliforme FACHB-838]